MFRGNTVEGNATALVIVEQHPFRRQILNATKVEEEDIHGSVDSMLEEMASCGFAVESMELANWLPASRVGKARLQAKLKLAIPV